MGRWLYASPKLKVLLGIDPAEVVEDPGAWGNHAHHADKGQALWRANSALRAPRLSAALRRRGAAAGPGRPRGGTRAA
jgi:hypothetical protein